MILCVNSNAAVDKTLVVENYRLNEIHRPSLELTLPGGKGCNVARAASVLGQQPVVTGWVGGHAGNFIEQGLRSEGIQTAFVRTEVDSRTCVSVLDPVSGSLTEVYEKGRPVSAGELQQFYDIFQAWLPKIQMVTLSGSLPPGVPDDFYARLIHLAQAVGIPAVLDTSGEPLRIGLEEGHPAVLKCNRAELAAVVTQPLNHLDEVRQAAEEISARSGIAVVITLGGAGAVAVEVGHTWLGQAPRIQALSAVGSGDAFLAGLVCGRLAGQPAPEALRLAIAAGAANAMQLGAGRLSQADVDKMAAQVVVARG